MLSIEAVRLNASTISLTLLFLAGFYLIYRDMRRVEDSIKRLDAVLGATMIPPPVFGDAADDEPSVFDDLVQQFSAPPPPQHPLIEEQPSPDRMELPAADTDTGAELQDAELLDGDAELPAAELAEFELA